MSLILHRATSRSLVLLDEFGKGTLTSDGVGLLAAILQHYAAQPVPPMLLACTHFVELLAPDILPTQPQLQYCTMHVLVSSAGAGSSAAEKGHGAAAGGSDGKHVFLYKLVQGKVAASYGVSLRCYAHVAAVSNAQPLSARSKGIVKARLVVKPVFCPYRVHVCVGFKQPLLDDLFALASC